MQEDKKINVRFLLSFVSLIFLLFLVFLNLEFNIIFLGISLLLMIVCFFTSYYGYLIMLEGLSKELFYNDNLKKENIEWSIDIVKFNMQILHSFLVMGIAVIALIFSLYTLYVKAEFIDSRKVILLAISMIFFITGLILAIITINYKWFKKYNNRTYAIRFNQSYSA